MTEETRAFLEREAQPILAPRESALTPPARWYVDPRVLELERREVFGASWLLVAAADALREPGAYAAGRILDEPWVVVRGDDGVLRAFSNVCRHHAAAVAQGTGRVRELVCPYHGWRYRLDGSLCSAPGLGRSDAFDVRDCRLPELRVREEGPLVFVSWSPAPRELDPDLRELASRLDLEGLRWCASRRYVLECNWKVYADNYLDGGYHVASLHPSLAAHLDLAGYRTELLERASLQSVEAARSDGAEFAERIGETARYAFLYPNLALNRYGPVLDTNRIRPLGPERTEVVFDFWLEEDRADDAEFVAACVEASERVQLEDEAVCRDVQRGLRSAAFRRGPYAAPELAMHHFHGLLARDLLRAADAEPST